MMNRRASSGIESVDDGTRPFHEVTVDQVLERTPDVATRTDDTLISAARTGNRTAFETLVARHLERTYRTALAILGNEPDASDATQDIFITVWRELPRLRDSERFPAWLGRIT